MKTVAIRTCRFCGEVVELHDNSEFDPNHICLPEPESTINHVKYTTAFVQASEGTNGNDKEK